MPARGHAGTGSRCILKFSAEPLLGDRIRTVMRLCGCSNSAVASFYEQPEMALDVLSQAYMEGPHSITDQK